MKAANEVKMGIVRSLKRQIIKNGQEMAPAFFKASQFLNQAGALIDDVNQWEIKVDDVIDVFYSLKELLNQAVEDAEDNIRYAERLEKEVEDNEARD